MDNKVVLVLDKLDYQKKQADYIDVLKIKYNEATVIYTEYEDDLIRRVRNWKVIGSALQHLLYWKKSYDYAKQVIRLHASIIICINPIVAIFLGLMNQKQKCSIILCGFLFEPKNNKLYYSIRKYITKRCLVGIRKAVVYAEQEVAYYNKIFPGVNKFVFVSYGIDYTTFTRYSGDLPEKYIFSGGGSNRDYKILVDAYNKLELQGDILPLCIATMPRCLEGLNVGSIHVLTDVVLETFGDVMSRSECLILSLKDSEISAGHQVMLEAMKNNVPVIINRIRAVEDYVTDKDVFFYKSGDSDELSNVIRNFLEDPKKVSTRELYEEKYSFKAFLVRLMNLV